jgi:hypothetical protein
MGQIIRRTLGSRWFLILGLMVCSAGIWAWQVRGQKITQPSSQLSVARQATGRNWECRKFVFGQENNASKDSVQGLEAFLQTASQAAITSSGVPDEGPYRGHYDVIACRQP